MDGKGGCMVKVWLPVTAGFLLLGCSLLTGCASSDVETRNQTNNQLMRLSTNQNQEPNSLNEEMELGIFKDVKDHWAEREIMSLFQEGIIGGYSDKTFKPNQILTRYQAAAMLIKALKLPLQENPTVTFKDIKKDSPMFRVAATINQEGLIRGSNGYFRPGEPLTRAQMAALLTRAFELQRNESFYFKDVQPDYWNYNEISAIAKSGISGGKEDGTFGGSEATTRAHFSVFLYRALKPEERRPIQPLAGDYGGFVEMGGSYYGIDNNIHFTIAAKNAEYKDIRNITFNDIWPNLDMSPGNRFIKEAGVQVEGDQIIVPVILNKQEKLFAYKDGIFTPYSEQFLPNRYKLNGKVYYTKGLTLMEKSGDNERVVKKLEDVSSHKLDYAGSKLFYISNGKVKSYDLLSGKESTIYSGKPAAYVDEFEGQIVILIKPYGTVITDYKGRVITTYKLGSFMSEYWGGLSIHDAADGSAGHIKR
jgi:hypothetical protein